MTELRIMPQPLVRRPSRIDNLELLGEFGNTVEFARAGVEDLQHRTSLLEGVSAYGNVAMTRNEWVVGGIGNGRPLLQFGQKVGEMKGVAILPGGVGLELGSQGLWRLDCYVWAASSGFTGDLWAHLDVEIRYPASMGGGIYHTHPFENDVNNGTVGGAYSFIAEAPGYQIRVYAMTGRWRRMLGGTTYSYLSVNKWNAEAVDAGTPEVPDGPGAPT